MDKRQSRPTRGGRGWRSAAVLGLLIAGCGGGGTGTDRDSGPNKTYLQVAASDADADALHYQWRVTAGTVENRDSAQTVWTMPEGPGLHFAYVTVSDGRGGYVEQQYAVGTDALNTGLPTPAAVSHTAPAIVDVDGSASRLRMSAADATLFAPPAGGAAVQRIVYLPDAAVQVVDQASGVTVFSGLTDLSGEASLPKLAAGQTYNVQCASSINAPLANCVSFVAGAEAKVVAVQPVLGVAQNLRLFGHVGFADGGVCGTISEFFGVQSAASVQLQLADGTALSPVLRANRFGDYAIDASVPVRGALKLQVRCEGYGQLLDVPASSDPNGYVSTLPIELSHQIANSRPQIVKVVASGGDGNVRGRMIVPEAGLSTQLPGNRQFLSMKGLDTRLSACMYYRALGAVKDCDAQGHMIEPITLDDWKRQHQFSPYAGTNTEVAANYINRMDLNLVRRMVATQTGPTDIAFVVCNAPGPDGTGQAEVDAVLDIGLADQKRVACVAMEWSPTPGANGGLPFTKFFTFAPDGTLLLSVNLDGRGEKFMPGTCVACHGGSKYNGRFPEHGSPSPHLGAGFLPFDTGNYLFSSRSDLTEAAQSEAIYQLNQLVRATEASDTTAVSRLIQGWYAGNRKTLDKGYVAPAWQAADAQTPGAARFYHDVVGISCRTCHVSLGSRFDWDSIVLSPSRTRTHVCGGTADVALNASMPNALISRDRVAERVQADPALAALMTSFLGCDKPLPDPAYPKR